MINLDFINKFDVWEFYLITVVIMFIVAFVSYWRGLKAKPTVKQIPSDIISNNILGLLALILGFSFSMAITRFDLRRELAIKESNAISSAYLRSELIHFERPKVVKELFKKYVDLRIEAYMSTRAREILKEVDQVRGEIWRNFTPVTVKERGELESAYLGSLNEMFEAADARTFALMKMLPPSFYLLILLLGASAFGLMSYDRGLSEDRSHWRSVLFILMFGIVFTFIYDMDHFRSGLITITQDSLSILRKGM